MNVDISKDIIDLLKLQYTNVFIVSPALDIFPYMEDETIILVETELNQSDLLGMGNNAENNSFGDSYNCFVTVFTSNITVLQEVKEYLKTNVLKQKNLILSRLSGIGTVWCDFIDNQGLNIDTAIDSVEKFPFKEMNRLRINLLNN